MTPEEQRILLSILQQQGAQTYSGIPSGVTTAGLNRQFDPRSLFLSGGVSTETVNQGIADAYAALTEDYGRKASGAGLYEASDMFLNAIPSRWASVTGTNPVASKWFNEAFDNLYAGIVTADGIKETIKDTPKEVQDIVAAQPNVFADFEEFSKTADSHKKAIVEQEYNRSISAAGAGPVPTMTDARTKYYTDAGAPEMALLPDPNAGYQFDPRTFIDNQGGQYDAAKSRGVNSQKVLNDLLYSQQGRSAIEQNKLAESYRMKALQAEAQRLAEASAPSANQGVWDTTKDIFGSAIRKAGIGAAIGGVGAGALALPLAPVGAAGGALTFGVPELAGNIVDWLQGDFNKEERAKKDAATKLAYAEQLAKLQAGYTPLTDQQALLRYSPDARLAQMNINKAQSDTFRAERDAQLLADAISRRLAASGRSPYADSVNNLLRLGK